MKDILVLYYSRHGSTRALAEAIAQGHSEAAAAAADQLMDYLRRFAQQVIA